MILQLEANTIDKLEFVFTLATLIPRIKSIDPFGFSWCNLEIILPTSVVKLTTTRLLNIVSS